MKILIVSWYFPPANTIGAVRIGGLAKYLLQQGHDIRVVAGKGLPYRQTLPLPLPENFITYARWADVNAGPKWLSRQLKRLRHGANSSVAADQSNENIRADIAQSGQPPSLLKRLSATYQNVVNWPDARIGWFPFALFAGVRVILRWRPQVIFASGPPFTGFLVGYCLSQFFRVPLIIEFRDRWWDDPYSEGPVWRQRLDKFAERLIARRAIGFSTVSEPWANTYRDTYCKPVEVIYNGYDEDLVAQSSSPGFDKKDTVRIVYTGGIYPGRRDPSPLFEAINLLGDAGRKIRVEFFGTDPSMVYPLAELYDVRERVIVHPEIDHAGAIEEQRHADVLLLMQWDDPKEQGNVPGKFFEYLGALRPILVLGLEDGVPAKFVRELNAGVYCGDSDAILKILRSWISLKEINGVIPSLSESSRCGFTRDAQFAKLSAFISENTS